MNFEFTSSSAFMTIEQMSFSNKYFKLTTSSSINLILYFIVFPSFEV